MVKYHFDWQMPQPLDGLVEHSDRILTNHAGAIERLGPGNQDSHVQTPLGHRKGEGEAQRQGS